MLKALVAAQKKYELDIETNKKINEADKKLAEQITKDTYTEN